MRGHCCALEEYFDRVNDSCESINDLYNGTHNCLKVDEDEKCIECKETF